MMRLQQLEQQCADSRHPVVAPLLLQGTSPAAGDNTLPEQQAVLAADLEVQAGPAKPAEAGTHKLASLQPQQQQLSGGTDSSSRRRSCVDSANEGEGHTDTSGSAPPPPRADPEVKSPLAQAAAAACAPQEPAGSPQRVRVLPGKQQPNSASSKSPAGLPIDGEALGRTAATSGQGPARARGRKQDALNPAQATHHGEARHDALPVRPGGPRSVAAEPGTAQQQQQQQGAARPLSAAAAGAGGAPVLGKRLKVSQSDTWQPASTEHASDEQGQLLARIDDHQWSARPRAAPSSQPALLWCRH